MNNYLNQCLIIIFKNCIIKIKKKILHTNNLSIPAQTNLTTEMWKLKVESRPTTLRILSRCIIILCICLTITSSVSFGLSGGQFVDNQFRQNWTSEKPGGQWHIASVVIDFIGMDLYLLFVICLYRRIRSFKDWKKVF